MLTKKQSLYLIGDLVVLAAALLASFYVRLPYRPELRDGLFAVLEHWTGASVLFVAVQLVSLYVFNNYNDRRVWLSPRAHAPVLASAGAAFLALSVAYYLAPAPWRFGRGLLGLQVGFAALGISLVRLAVEILFKHRPLRTRVLVVGAGEAARGLGRDLLGAGDPNHELVGFVDPGTTHARNLDGFAVHPRPADLFAFAREQEVGLLVLAPENGASLDPVLVRELMACKMGGVEVQDLQSLYKARAGRVPVRHVAPQYFLVGGGFDIPSRPVLRNVLRLADVVVAAVGLILSLPLWPLVALAIKIGSRGPVFFTQTRVGLGKRPFRIVKFRTMVQDAEANGPAWAEAGRDPRVTGVGRLLRRTRLDELPQFLNILKGDMSFIGPRPERPEFVESLEKEIPFYDLRFAVRPGLTGWAQVNFRYGASVEDAAVKLEYDLYYIQHNSVWLNLRIVLKTVQTLIMRPGS